MENESSGPVRTSTTPIPTMRTRPKTRTIRLGCLSRMFRRALPRNSNLSTNEDFGAFRKTLSRPGHEMYHAKRHPIENDSWAQENEVREAESGTRSADRADRRHIGRRGTGRAARAGRIHGDAIGSGITHVEVAGGIKRHTPGVDEPGICPTDVTNRRHIGLGGVIEPADIGSVHCDATLIGHVEVAGTIQRYTTGLVESGVGTIDSAPGRHTGLGGPCSPAGTGYVDVDTAAAFPVRAHGIGNVEAPGGIEDHAARFE